MSLELFINPALGRHRISDIARADVARFHHELRDRSYQANRALGVLSKMMSTAKPNGSGILQTKSCSEALSHAQANKTESRFALAALGLLILTGARLNEILTLKWA